MGRKGLSRGLFLVITLLLVFVALYSGLQILESAVLQTDGGGETGSGKTVTRNGIEYYPRQDITVVMLLGIDNQGPVKESESYDNPGAADMITLMIFDRKTEKCDLLVFNRDTMVEMPVIGLTGKPAGTYYGQLALSHTFGSGLEDSCVNTRTTVSNLLLGAPIDYYFAMNMDGIGILNDAVGGVEVTIEDDFSLVDPTLVMGQTIRLNGRQAVNFVRTRHNVGDQLNLSRMERHKAYMRGFATALKEKLEGDPLFASQLLEQVSDYTVTDCTGTVLNRLASDFGDYELGQILTPEGGNVLGEEYYEYRLDAEKLEQLALALFFEPKKQ